jgi:hypothetical protein
MTTAAPPPAILERWMAGLIDLFSPRTRQQVLILVAGAVLAPSRRTVSAVLRVMGLGQVPTFTTYHRVLNRNTWSGAALARRLLGLLVAAFVPSGRVVVGLDDTLERRQGGRIAAKGIYRDPVRSSRSHFVKASGLRWLSLMLLAPVPWAGRVWALPVLTVLAPSERYHQQRGLRPAVLILRMEAKEKAFRTERSVIQALLWSGWKNILRRCESAAGSCRTSGRAATVAMGWPTLGFRRFRCFSCKARRFWRTSGCWRSTAAARMGTAAKGSA